ncbi:MAG: hypothetical protein ACREUB_02690 [Burkholderiales bacterium]
MALRWISGGGVDHPLANPVQARQVVAELPARDSTKALEEIIEWLESLNRADGIKVDRRYESIDLLDGAARHHQRELTQEYLSTPRVQKFQENRLWNAGFGVCKELGEAYVRCIKECVSGFDGSSAVQKVLPAIAARALRALAMQLKWTLLRYGLVERRIWTHLALLYRLGEERQMSEQAVAVYPAPHPRSTVKREFLKALMLPASSLDGLAPAKQQIAERTVAHFSESFLLSAKAAGCTHSFDLTAPRPPARLVPGVAEAGLLFFGAGDALDRLDRLSEQIAARDGVPHDFNLGGSYPKDEVIAVLRHLAQYWSDTPPARGSERRPTAARITVVPGADQVFGVLEPSATVSTLDFSRNQTAESWIVENVSDGGCGAIVPPQKIDWVRVGALIGMKSETSEHLGIGVIRRITRDAHEQRRVGIQVLTRTAIPVTIAKASTMTALNFDLREETAILLTVKPDERGEIEMLLREGIFNGRDVLEMTVQRRSYRLVPLRVLETGEDFHWARFKVTKRGE